MAKSLNYLKANRAKHGEYYEHNGNRIQFHGETSRISAHYKLFPTNMHGTTKSKKRAISFLKNGF